MTTGMTTQIRRFSNPFNHPFEPYPSGCGRGFIYHFTSNEAYMLIYFTAAIIVGLIVHALGMYTVKLSIFMITFKVIAIALVVVALILLYRKFRSRGRAGRPRRLGR
jgi:uncharacterized membrane protein YecN with MAPEG domain